MSAAMSGAGFVPACARFSQQLSLLRRFDPAAVKAPESGSVHDLKAKLEKVRLEAEDCALVGRLAADPFKRETFRKLARQLREAGRDMECAICKGDEVRSSGSVKSNLLAAMPAAHEQTAPE